MAGLGGAYVYIMTDTSKLKTGLAKARGMVSTGADKMSKGFARVQRAVFSLQGAIVAMGGALVASKVVSELGKTVEAASRLQETTSKFETVFAGQMDKANQFVDVLAEGYAMSTREARYLLGGMQDLLVPLGMSTTAAADMSQEVVKLSADIGSFNDLPTTDVLENIRSALVGEYEPMRKFGVSLSAATVQQRALNMGLAAGVKELTAADKAQAAFKMIVEGSSFAVGDMNKTMDSYANVSKQLDATLEELSGTIGTALLPYVTAVKEGVAGWIKENTSLIKQNLPEYMVSIGSALQFAVKTVGFFHKGWASIELAIVSVWNQVKLFTADFYTLITRKVLLPFDMLYDGLVKLGVVSSNPFDAIQEKMDAMAATALESNDAMVSGYRDLLKKYDDIDLAIERMKSSILDTAIEHDKATTAVKEGAGAMQTAIDAVSDKSGSMALDIKNDASSAAMDAASSFKNDYRVPVIEDLDTIGNHFDDVLEGQELALGSHLSTLDEMWGEHSRYVGEVMQQTTNLGGAGFQGDWNGPTPTWNPTAGGIYSDPNAPKQSQASAPSYQEPTTVNINTNIEPEVLVADPHQQNELARKMEESIRRAMKDYAARAGGYGPWGKPSTGYVD